MLVYCPDSSPRLIHTCDVLLKILCQRDYSITSDSAAYQSADDKLRLNYSNEPSLPGLHIPAEGLLSENDIRTELPEPIWVDHQFALFGQRDSKLGFDLFAAAFYWLVCYQEYQSDKTDKHGRFPAAESLQQRMGALQVPWVHRYAIQLQQRLLELYPRFEMRLPDFSFRPTFDIDIAYAYSGRTAYRWTGAMMRDLLSFHFSAVRSRIATAFGAGKDPYRTYDLFLSLCAGMKPICFFPAGPNGPMDRHIPISHPLMRKDLQQLRESGTEIGLHPTYEAGGRAQLQAEKEQLESVAGLAVRSSRHHYIRIDLPKSYRQLIEIGITDDFSMGFPELPGFRNGMSVPHPWYDLENEQQTDLSIHPFALMDASFQYYKESDPGERIRQIVDELKLSGGVLISDWHNNSFSKQFAKGVYAAHFRELLSYATDD